MGDFPYTLEVCHPALTARSPTRGTGGAQRGAWSRSLPRTLVPVTGRVISADSDGVILDVEGTHRRFGYSALGAGAIQVEFGHLPTEFGATGDGH